MTCHENSRFSGQLWFDVRKLYDNELVIYES